MRPKIDHQSPLIISIPGADPDMALNPYTASYYSVTEGTFTRDTLNTELGVRQNSVRQWCRENLDDSKISFVQFAMFDTSQGTDNRIGVGFCALDPGADLLKEFDCSPEQWREEMIEQIIESNVDCLEYFRRYPSLFEKLSAFFHLPITQRAFALRFKHVIVGFHDSYTKISGAGERT